MYKVQKKGSKRHFMKLLYFNIDFLVILLLHDFVYVCNSGVAPIPPDILHYDNILWRPTLAAAAAASAAAHCVGTATAPPSGSHVTPSPLSSSGSEDVSTMYNQGYQFGRFDIKQLCLFHHKEEKENKEYVLHRCDISID